MGKLAARQASGPAGSIGFDKQTTARGGGDACCNDVGHGDDAGHLPRTPPARSGRLQPPPIKLPSTYSCLFLLGVNATFFSLILPFAAPTALHGEREGKHLGLAMVSQIYRRTRCARAVRPPRLPVQRRLSQPIHCSVDCPQSIHVYRRRVASAVPSRTGRW